MISISRFIDGDLSLHDQAVEARFEDSLAELHRRTDRFFARLLLAQWLAAIGLAFIVTPQTWAGAVSSVHFHVWLAVLGGGVICIFPAILGLKQSGRTATRHLLAVAQMLMSGLFIHLTGGRIETHFHVFGSLAFIAFYRDIRVLLSATAVVYLDHVLRGSFLPQSVYGVATATPWRSIEHAFWVMFEIAFLSGSIRRSLKEMHQVAQRQILMETLHEESEQTVQTRTRELDVSEKRFQALFQNAAVGLYHAAPDGRLLVANAKLIQVLGYQSLDELTAAGVRLQGSEQERARTELFEELQLKGEVRSRDAIWLKRDGLPIVVRESARAFRDKDETLLYFEGTVEDVTERRQLEERYLQAQKVQAIGQLAGGVAHDFNNILTTILGYSDIVLNAEGPRADDEKYVQEIRKSAERAAGLTQQLLAFGRKQTLQPRVIQLNTTVSEMDTMLRRLVGEHIHIRTLASPDLTPVKADPSQIQQILMNLVVNARDAMPNGGNLTIETCNVALDEDYARQHPEVGPGAYVMLAVSDNGTGMTPEVKARIFEPFFTTKEVGVGTGLGLSTCYGITKQSGGHIAVYSELGHGTTFKVYLPATTEFLVTEQKIEEPSDLHCGDETVLLVEDEPMVRELGRLALSSLGYRVFEAENGQEALQRFAELGATSIHLVVTDVVMPVMGGKELAERIRRISPQTRVLFSSGYTADAIERTDLLGEGIYFLQKPYTISLLAKKVREVLGVPAANGKSAHPAKMNGA